MSEYAFRTSIPVRHVDRDRLGHVNNAVYATYLEEARIAYFEEALGLSLEERSMLIASLSIDFEGDIRTGPASVGVEMTAIGDSSFDLAYEIRLGDRIVATAETVQVAYDVEAEETIPFPEEWRTAVAELQDGVPDQ
ncbi:MAG: acyl-CoA thioesterase [Halodesulfurarchaeum sp.]